MPKRYRRKGKVFTRLKDLKDLLIMLLEKIVFVISMPTRERNFADSVESVLDGIQVTCAIIVANPITTNQTTRAVLISSVRTTWLV